MLKLSDVQGYIISLALTESERVYIGKLDSKQERSIGIYSRKGEGNPVMALGGQQYSSYDIKPISILVHWNKDKVDTETAAFKLFDTIRKETSLTIGNIHISYIRIMVPEPQDIGTDDNGVYEYVIWLDFIYQRGA